MPQPHMPHTDDDSTILHTPHQIENPNRFAISFSDLEAKIYDYNDVFVGTVSSRLIYKDIPMDALVLAV